MLPGHDQESIYPPRALARRALAALSAVIVLVALTTVAPLPNDVPLLGDNHAPAAAAHTDTKQSCTRQPVYDTRTVYEKIPVYRTIAAFRNGVPSGYRYVAMTATVLTGYETVCKTVNVSHSHPKAKIGISLLVASPCGVFGPWLYTVCSSVVAVVIDQGGDDTTPLAGCDDPISPLQCTAR